MSFGSHDISHTLCRLRHNVIKTGIRMICLSYSRISLADVATKLSLESTQDAEYIVSKAIKDGVIEAVINHEKGYVQSRVRSTSCFCFLTALDGIIDHCFRRIFWDISVYI